MGGQERKEGKFQQCADVLAELTWLDFAVVREQGLPLGLIFQDESECVFHHKKYAFLYRFVSLHHPLCLKIFSDSLLPKGVQAIIVGHSRFLPAFFVTSPSPLLCNSPFQITSPPTGSPKCLLWIPFPCLCSRWFSGKSSLLILRWPAQVPGLGTHLGLRNID